MYRILELVVSMRFASFPLHAVCEPGRGETHLEKKNVLLTSIYTDSQWFSTVVTPLLEPFWDTALSSYRRESVEVLMSMSRLPGHRRNVGAVLVGPRAPEERIAPGTVYDVTGELSKFLLALTTIFPMCQRPVNPP